MEPAGFTRRSSAMPPTYQRRVQRYLAKHPNATMQQARGTKPPAFYITHTDEAGEHHQLRGAWEAPNAAAAIAQMLAESQTVDDGRWEAHEVTSERDIVP
jgi:hypothetical protein